MVINWFVYRAPWKILIKNEKAYFIFKKMK